MATKSPSLLEAVVADGRPPAPAHRLRLALLRLLRALPVDQARVPAARHHVSRDDAGPAVRHRRLPGRGLHVSRSRRLRRRPRRHRDSLLLARRGAARRGRGVGVVDHRHQRRDRFPSASCRISATAISTHGTASAPLPSRPSSWRVFLRSRVLVRNAPRGHAGSVLRRLEGRRRLGHLALLATGVGMLLAGATILIRWAVTRPSCHRISSSWGADRRSQRGEPSARSVDRARPRRVRRAASSSAGFTVAACALVRDAFPESVAGAGRSRCRGLRRGPSVCIRPSATRIGSTCASDSGSVLSRDRSRPRGARSLRRLEPASVTRTRAS